MNDGCFWTNDKYCLKRRDDGTINSPLMLFRSQESAPGSRRSRGRRQSRGRGGLRGSPSRGKLRSGYGRSGGTWSNLQWIKRISIKPVRWTSYSFLALVLKCSHFLIIHKSGDETLPLAHEEGRNVTIQQRERRREKTLCFRAIKNIFLGAGSTKRKGTYVHTKNKIYDHYLD